VVGCCEHGNEHSRYIKGREFLDLLSDWHIIDKESMEWMNQ
jgi:hypothetical protein